MLFDQPSRSTGFGIHVLVHVALLDVVRLTKPIDRLCHSDDPEELEGAAYAGSINEANRQALLQHASQTSSTLNFASRFSRG